MPFNKEKIKYLAFEGGGGKGNAYLGAIKALEKGDVLNHIEGFSGASAGAITAFLLSCNYNYAQIRQILTADYAPVWRNLDPGPEKQGFNVFYDIPEVGKEMTVRGPINNKDIQNKYNKKLEPAEEAKIVFIATAIIGPYLPYITNPYLIYELYTSEKVRCIIKEFKKFQQEYPILYKRLKSNWKSYINSLYYDFGLFTGEKIFYFFDSLLKNAVSINNSKKKEGEKFLLPGSPLFCWNNIPANENENVKLINFLKVNYGLDWVKTAKIGAKDIGKDSENHTIETIRVFDGDKLLFLIFNQYNLKIFIRNADNYGKKDILLVKEIVVRDERKWYAYRSSSSSDITFEQHYRIFNKDLKVSAVNLSTQQLHILDHINTPNLPVALAIRMSMSIPAVFKPVRIYPDHIVEYTEFEKKILPGLWIDGGVLDNAPVRPYDSSKVILFRLGVREQEDNITDLLSFLQTWISLGVMGAGSALVTRTTYDNDHIVTLDITDLDMLKFDVPSHLLTRLEELNCKITENFLSQRRSKKRSG